MAERFGHAGKWWCPWDGALAVPSPLTGDIPNK